MSPAETADDMPAGGETPEAVMLDALADIVGRLERQEEFMLRIMEIVALHTCGDLSIERIIRREVFDGLPADIQVIVHEALSRSAPR